MRERLAIITTHPVQYNAPLFKELAKRNVLDSKVFYTWGEGGLGKKYDYGFGKEIEWDIPLLEGYSYEFMTNISKNPGVHHFYGIINPDLFAKIDAFKPS